MDHIRLWENFGKRHRPLEDAVTSSLLISCFSILQTLVCRAQIKPTTFSLIFTRTSKMSKKRTISELNAKEDFHTNGIDVASPVRILLTVWDFCSDQAQKIRKISQVNGMNGKANSDHQSLFELSSDQAKALSGLYSAPTIAKIWGIAQRALVNVNTSLLDIDFEDFGHLTNRFSVKSSYLIPWVHQAWKKRLCLSRTRLLDLGILPRVSLSTPRATTKPPSLFPAISLLWSSTNTSSDTVVVSLSQWYKRWLWQLFSYACKWWTENLHQNAQLTTTHDLSFMISPWARKAWELERDSRSYETLITAAQTLATRYNEKVGCLRSWDTCVTKRYSFLDPSLDFLVIIVSNDQHLSSRTRSGTNIKISWPNRITC